MNPVDAAADLIAGGFRRLVSGDPDGQPEWVRQLEHGSDTGYFGPGSAAWAVHGSLPTLVGGVRALLVQALHPAALAGVQEHSRYEDDALGRLAGTTQWLTVVTFGDTAQADRECARVRGLHRKVRGTYDADGERRPYAASDPDLLRWVHVAFTDSFLATHRVWGGPIPGGEDAYVREWAKAGELVGVDDPPRSVAELDDQMAGFAPVLRRSEASERTVRFIRNAPLPLPARPPYGLLFAGAVSTLPAEQRRLLGLPAVPQALTRPAVGALL
ncbi:MAG: oxygenase MpaB family protein, partial [Candidatus Nanopelagicales bacterium]